MIPVTAILASYAAEATWEGLPADVRREAARAFVNWVGCAAGGSIEPVVSGSIRVMQAHGEQGPAPVVGRTETLSILGAAFVNATSSGALAFNDTHFASGAHPTSPVAGVLLAISSAHKVRGDDFLLALALGIEIQCRVANILAAHPAETQVALHMAGMVGGIGSAVAAARIFGLSAAGIATAIGHAANMATGLRQTHGSMANQLTQGHAARAGLMAASLARHGLSCDSSMLEGPKGFGNTYARKPNYLAAVHRLGHEFEIRALSYKPYPSGFVTHAAIDGCLELARSERLDIDDIERIDLEVSPLTMELCNRQEPTDRDSSLLSVQYWAAAALATGHAGLSQASEAMRSDPRMRSLRSKVSAAADTQLPVHAARVRLHLNDRRTLEVSIANCKSSPGNPLQDGELSVKALEQLGGCFGSAKAREILAECWSLANAANTTSLVSRLKNSTG